MNECTFLGPLCSVKEQKEISTVFYPKKACLDSTKKEYAVHSGQAAGLQWALPDSGVRRASPAACPEYRHLSTTDAPLLARTYQMPLHTSICSQPSSRCDLGSICGAQLHKTNGADQSFFVLHTRFFFAKIDPCLQNRSVKASSF